MYLIGCLRIKRNNTNKKPSARHTTMPSTHKVLLLVTIIIIGFFLKC